MLLPFIWCGKWDLNPYVKDTRPSNVPVCLFQHYRVFSNARVIISALLQKVKNFFEKILIIYFCFRENSNQDEKKVFF